MDKTPEHARRDRCAPGRAGLESAQTPARPPAAAQPDQPSPGREAPHCLGPDRAVPGRGAPAHRPSPDRAARAALLEQTRLARDMDWRSLLVLAGFMTYREHAAGAFLYQEGEPGGELAVLLCGVLSVVKRGPDGAEARVGEIHARAVVGEVALLDGGPRSASVYAQTPVALLALRRQALERIREAHPRVAARLLAALAAEVSGRLRLATARLARHGGGDAFALEDV